MSTYFSKQKKDVINKLPDHLNPQKFLKASLLESSELFNIDEWAAKLSEDGREYMMAVVAEAGQQIIEAIETGTFDPLTPNIRNVIGSRVREFSQDINVTTKKRLQRLLRDSIAAGDEIEVTANKIREMFNQFSKWRANLIARTETYYASNFGTQEAMRQAKVQRKMWITSRDDRVRDTHQIDGQVVGVDEDFMLADGSQMPWPMDFNERCIHIPTIEPKT